MKHELTGSGGKGSAPRSVDKSKFDKEFDRIFGTKDTKNAQPSGCMCPKDKYSEPCDCPACGGFND